ncbi:sensor histidine kinase [uncultured Acetatifactor sp.]|uniref:sensor histidine kinase n=1 Tax=uncultured Acetatifactor sp. TaxID=1671927 RepID=UPI0026142412|nr:sensor histidine kinase [uncultured Acetatifactor sp.]MCI8695977.1 sensor histidine kinase [Lachnospiraceae bacterium]
MDMGKVREWFRNASLRGKILLLIVLGGILPVGIVMAVSFATVRIQTEERLIYALNQGYSQVYQAVGDKLSRLHNISTLFAVNDMASPVLRFDDKEMDVAEQLMLFENINSYAYGLEMTMDSSNIVFYIEDSYLVVNAQSSRYRPLTDAYGSRWYQSLRENNGRPVWVLLDGSGKGGSYAAIARELWNPDDYSQTVGILAILMERKNLENMLQNAYEEQELYLETADGTLLASNLPEEALHRLSVSQRNVDDREFGSITLGGEPCYARSCRIDGSNVYLVSVIPKGAVREGMNVPNGGMGMVFLGVSLLVVMVMATMAKSITGRLKLLKEQMLRIQEGNICKMEEGPSRDEIGQLIGNYNVMVDQVEALLREQYILGQEKVEAELKALQSQINPHFLYNTLDMINWMSQKKESENIRSVVQAMSRFYRLTLSKGRDIVSIRDEVEMCEAYMEIQKRRYRGRICYEVEVDGDILDCLIPKITLQPFLENAIIHGINEKADGRGMVILNGWMEDGRITLSVTDDGEGMTQEDKKKSHQGSHYGLSNIEHRLELFFGEGIPVQVESSPGIGTCVIINIPVRTEAEEAVEHEK